ncbi:hypothetical protein AVEN_205467-1 [Araneus ventricosus]|uniref:Uncharacterized protein n=1 Tax=Araneus ventricosus TaxID=182803 RepID=A0A4Y2CCT3_ARAVE|nr:hypothetical protein AVEN_205467-1 [Araneus ventricosus]
MLAKPLTTTRVKRKPYYSPGTTDPCYATGHSDKREQYGTFLFTEESRFILTPDSPTFIWRELGIHYLSSNIREGNHYGNRDLICTGIMLDERIPLNFGKRSVTAVGYRDEVIEPCICIIGGALDSNFIFMNNNIRSHSTYVDDEFLEDEDIR